MPFKNAGCSERGGQAGVDLMSGSVPGRKGPLDQLAAKVRRSCLMETTGIIRKLLG